MVPVTIKPAPNYIFKVVIAGEGGVGKTTMVQRLIKGKFIEGLKMTIGTALSTHKIPVDGEEVVIQAWDFAGEKRFRFFLPSYCKGAAGVLLVYDITRYSTFRDLEEWIGILRKNAPSNAVFILIGAKSDLVDKQIVKDQDAADLMEKEAFFKYFKASSKTGDNIHEIFEVLAREMLVRVKSLEM